ncbi:MAG: hypothetical protein HGA51_10055, partial [Demequinaceae bacterium]|nr:hypothetical protein [Demequinaceae bacterium]
MSEQLLLWVYGSSALIAAVVFFATVRAPGIASLRLGLLVYLAGTAWWAIVDIIRWVVGPSAIPMVEAWTLPAGALVIAGVRVGVHSAIHAGRKASLLDIVGFAIHPALAVVVACVPMLWGTVAVQAADGSVVYGPLFWAHISVIYALLVAATIDMFRGRETSRLLNRRTAPVVMSIWTVPLVASVVTILSSGPHGIDLMPPGFALTSLLIWRTLVPADVRQAVRIARSQVLEELADAVIVLGNSGNILDANAAALRLVGAQGAISDYVDKPL